MCRTGISLFTGAGGMDVGFSKAGFDVLWANDFDSDCCKTYQANHKNIIKCGDINDFFEELENYKGVDVLFGGPPCQGFSVAGKMDPNDERSKLVWAFAKAVEITKPKAFVMENVKALAELEKFKDIRNELLIKLTKLGYKCLLTVVNAQDFGVPQKRERMLIFGFKDAPFVVNVEKIMEKFKKKPIPVKKVLLKLGKAGTEHNKKICKALVTFASHPVLRKSPYAGMMFNGQGRPIDPDKPCNTLPASMGGNRTPIVDEDYVYDGSNNWIEEYHHHLMTGGIPKEGVAPKRLRRLTVDEAAQIQTYPEDYIFVGSQSSVFKQIGNAVPCNLAEATGKTVFDILDKLENSPKELPYVSF